MTTIRVTVGTETHVCVEFEGEELAQVRERVDATDGTRGITETLYRASDGRLILHTHHWTRWAGETSRWTLQAVTVDDLGPDGAYWQLGAAAGFGHALTLDEALGDD